jgi:potassium-transporting ATPase KdpC subunit
MLSALRPALVMTLLFTLLTGIAYPLLVTGIGQVAFPHQANGSLIEQGGRVIGSELIAQGFAADRYLHPRPSAAGKDGYDATSSAGTNLAPGSKDLRDAIEKRVADARAHGLTGPNVPPDLVTTSASGLDPDLSPEAAFSQSTRIAKARGMTVGAVRALIERNVERPVLPFLGDPVVNVLAVNRQLDALSANKAP